MATASVPVHRLELRLTRSGNRPVTASLWYSNRTERGQVVWRRMLREVVLPLRLSTEPPGPLSALSLALEALEALDGVTGRAAPSASPEGAAPPGGPRGDTPPGS